MIDNNSSLIDQEGRELASFSIGEELEGWYYGKMKWQALPEKVLEALRFYDEIIANQTLSLLDEALASIESCQLRIRLQGQVHPVYSLHLASTGDVSFRTTPVKNPSCEQSHS